MPLTHQAAPSRLGFNTDPAGDPQAADLLLVAEVVAQRAAQLPADGFLVGLLASLRLAGGPPLIRGGPIPILKES